MIRKKLALSDIKRRAGSDDDSASERRLQWLKYIAIQNVPHVRRL